MQKQEAMRNLIETRKTVVYILVQVIHSLAFQGYDQISSTMLHEAVSILDTAHQNFIDAEG